MVVLNSRFLPLYVSFQFQIFPSSKPLLPFFLCSRVRLRKEEKLREQEQRMKEKEEKLKAGLLTNKSV